MMVNAVNAVSMALTPFTRSDMTVNMVGRARNASVNGALRVV
jgi:hypothetical protein